MSHRDSGYAERSQGDVGKYWVMAQSKDPAIREIKYLINNKKLKGQKVFSWDPQITKQYVRQHSH